MLPFPFSVVFPGRAKREPGIHFTAEYEVGWIPGSTRSLSSGARSRDPVASPRNDGKSAVRRQMDSGLVLRTPRNDGEGVPIVWPAE
jgi:hypothetical protein